MSENSIRRDIKKEIIGVAIILGGIFIILSFISYNPDDRAYYLVYNTAKVRNWGGIVGSTLSRALFQLVGLASYLLPLILFIFASRFFVNLEILSGYFRMASCLFLFLSLVGLFDLTLGIVRLKGEEMAAGGILGRVLTGYLMRYFNPVGTYCFYLSIFLISFLGATYLSPVRLAVTFKNLFLSVFKKISTPLIKVKEKMIEEKDIKIREKEFLIPPLSYEVNPEEKVEVEGVIEKSQLKEPREKLLDKVDEFSEVDSKKKGFKQEIREVKEYRLPPLSFLELPEQKVGKMDREALINQSRTLERKLKDFGVEGRIVEINPGPVVTRFEFEPAPGIKINKVVGLADDLALALRAISVRIVAPIPGKGAIGIEVPNLIRETVYFKEIVSQEAFLNSKSKLTLVLGKDLSGEPVITTLDSMPHLLVAGATGAGKSVLINTFICSILYKATPDEVKMLMIDPKRLELSLYEGIPHLLYPVVTDPKKASLVLKWAVEEMERRYTKLAEKGVRDIDRYNQKVAEELRNGLKSQSREDYARENDGHQILPYIVIIIDELADLMMVSSREVEGSLTRLAQMARAAGIHLIVATQRPSVDVITGTIKVNFPTRISFQLASKTDSRTILDTIGAERLLGKGDMLFLPPGNSKLVRIHGAYVSETEITRIVEFLKEQGKPSYDETIISLQEAEIHHPEEEDFDEKYAEAVALVIETRQASISMIQRRLRVGYNRAARMIERMEKEGIVSQTDGTRPREVLVRRM